MHDGMHDAYSLAGAASEIGSLTSLMHVTQVHPMTAENQFHCTRLYVQQELTLNIPFLIQDARSPMHTLDCN